MGLATSAVSHQDGRRPLRSMPSSGSVKRMALISTIFIVVLLAIGRTIDLYRRQYVNGLSDSGSEDRAVIFALRVTQIDE